MRRALRRLWQGRWSVYGTGYAALTGLYLLCASLSPALALQLDATKYVRVVEQAEAIALQAAQKATVADAVGAAAVLGSPVSVGVRVLAAGLAIGIPLGLAMWNYFYSPSDVAAVKSNADAVYGNYGIQNTSLLNGASIRGACAGSSCNLDGKGAMDSGYDAQVSVSHDGFGGCSPSQWLSPSAYWAAYAVVNGSTGQTCYFEHLASDTSHQVYVSSGATAGQVSSYLQGLSDSNSLSLQSHLTSLGVGVTPASADQVTALTQALTDLTTKVKKLADVLPTDITVATNVPPPQNVTITTNVTNTTTNVSNVSSVTNADGSTTTTEQKAETSSPSCTSNAKDPRTFATVLQAHQQQWQATGLVASLNALKNLTFPGAVPVISLPTHLFGTLTLDFTRWAWVFTAIQSIMIAFAGMVAIRIVFIGR